MIKKSNLGSGYSAKSVTSVHRPKMKRDAGVNAVFFLSKKTAFTPASLFIFGRRTDIMLLVHFAATLVHFKTWIN